jgi:hypothetical protein
MQSVIETPTFLADAKAAGVLVDERAAIVDFIARNPKIGDLIPGSGGARKIRIAGRGKGKSGGYRVITYFGGEDIPVFLLSMFSKGEKTNLRPSEVSGLRALLNVLASAYRQGTKGGKDRK